jgi:hypothetical protein
LDLELLVCLEYPVFLGFPGDLVVLEFLLLMVYYISICIGTLIF